MLEDLRKEIDAIDDQIIKLYEERMRISRKVGIQKAAENKSVENILREKEIINRVTSKVPDEIKLYAKRLFTTIFRNKQSLPAAVRKRRGGREGRSSSRC